MSCDGRSSSSGGGGGRSVGGVEDARSQDAATAATTAAADRAASPVPVSSCDLRAASDCRSLTLLVSSFALILDYPGHPSLPPPLHAATAFFLTSHVSRRPCVFREEIYGVLLLVQHTERADARRNRGARQEGSRRGESRAENERRCRSASTVCPPSCF